MRLIDADALKKDLKSVTLSNGTLVNTNAVLYLLEEYPTSYDVDKVVEQLEERTAFLKDCTKYGNKTAEQQSKSYDTMMMYEVKDLVDDLLEIVKAGGADAKTDS